MWFVAGLYSDFIWWLTKPPKRAPPIPTWWTALVWLRFTNQTMPTSILSSSMAWMDILSRHGPAKNHTSSGPPTYYHPFSKTRRPAYWCTATTQTSSLSPMAHPKIESIIMPSLSSRRLQETDGWLFPSLIKKPVDRADVCADSQDDWAPYHLRRPFTGWTCGQASE